ncbi:hypothetical protein PIB30_088923, partial [Stylosanthes scabra]|nr:hypothetical protein [Stylosanthes scabra]
KHLWKLLWELRCPPKVKVFLWKALLNGLPVRQHLKQLFPIVVDSDAANLFTIHNNPTSVHQIK